MGRFELSKVQARQCEKMIEECLVDQTSVRDVAAWAFKSGVMQALGHVLEKFTDDLSPSLVREIGDLQTAYDRADFSEAPCSAN